MAHTFFLSINADRYRQSCRGVARHETVADHSMTTTSVPMSYTFSTWYSQRPGSISRVVVMAATKVKRGNGLHRLSFRSARYPRVSMPKPSKQPRSTLSSDRIHRCRHSLNISRRTNWGRRQEDSGAAGYRDPLAERRFSPRPNWVDIPARSPVGEAPGCTATGAYGLLL